MDQCSGKRGPSGPAIPRKTYTAAFKESTTDVDQNVQFCNRSRCSGRTKNGPNTKIGILDKPKCSRPTFRSSVGNEITRNSTSAKNPYFDSKRKLMSSQSSLTGYECSSVSSNIRPRKISDHKSGSRNQNAPSPPSVRSASRSTVEKKTMKKRSLEGETSLPRRERNTTSSASPVDNNNRRSISISDSRRVSASGEDSASAWTRRSMTVNASTRLSNRQNGRNGSSVRECAAGISEIPDMELSSSSVQFSTSSSRMYVSRGNGENSSDELGFANLMNDDDVFRGYNMGRIAEMLLALDRIEQDEELTHEDLLALEASLFLRGLNLYDQHREMRLDIDNMSYEELLALEERMGTVSTALPQETLSKCIKRSIYEVTPSEVQITGCIDDGDEIKCSICQEEYITGDEIGTLVECQHGYHMTCINHWLQLKNWCPVCKTSAAPSQSSSCL